MRFVYRFTIYSSLDEVVISSLSIYDRHGSKVFTGLGIATNNPDLGWDGRMNSINVEQGVYVYVAVVNIGGCEVINLSGDVTVIR